LPSEKPKYVAPKKTKKKQPINKKKIKIKIKIKVWFFLVFFFME